MIKNLLDTLKEVTAEQGDTIEEIFVDKLIDLKLGEKYDDNLEYQDAKLYEKFLKLEENSSFSWDLLDTVQQLPNFDGLDIARNNSILKIPDYQQKTHIKYKRKGIDGDIIGFNEQVKYDELLLSNNDKVCSLKRKIDPTVNKITGSSENKPFLPGLKTANKYTANREPADASDKLHKDDFGLFDIPPFMKRGISPAINADISETEKSDENLASLLQLEGTLDSSDDMERIRKDLLNKIEANNDSEISESLGKLRSLLETTNDKNKKAIDELLPETISFGRVNKNISGNNNSAIQIHWAHEVNINHHIPNFDELIPHPARSWPFELDTFQKEAILHLEQGDSVFVAAHTSAGKTVVAEYAIAMSKRNMTKTIYTSPIKALSNQKFRDFKTTFDDIEIGLITGDVQINKDADCLIMTTEILRSMLYKGADLLRDVEFVIFDEVHYINDQERGVVWEEVIIMLPPYVKFVLLSATVPNTFEFANWIGRTKQKNIYVISTPKRPVPLEINIWAKEKMLPVINSNREFIDANFKKHIQLLQPKAIENKNGDNKKAGDAKKKMVSTTRFQNYNGPSKNTWPSLLGELKKRNLLPAVIFVFSQKKCSEYADQLANLNFINAKESSHVRMLIDRSINRLKKEDRELPQILAISSLLQKGVAVHHGGLLPIVKELVEILFAEGYIKVLFATETFAMGLNLPTRTVVFSEIRKHDGNQQRYLNPGEFTQMAGRAGRRGLDDCGTVIIMSYKDPLNSLSFKEVTLGKPTKLESQFRLTYNMIVNLLRIESLKMEDMIQFSFGEDKGQQHKLEVTAKEVGYEEILESEILKNLKVNCDSCTEKILDDFLNLLEEYETTHKEALELYSSSKSVLVNIETGRVVIYRSVVNTKVAYNVGVIFKSTNSKGAIVVMKITEDMFIDFGIDANSSKLYIPYISNLAMFDKKFALSDQFMMKDISIVDIEYLTDIKSRNALFMALSNDEKKQDTVNKLLKGTLKLLEPIKFKGMIDIDLSNLLNRERKLRQQIIASESKLTSCDKYRLHFFERWQINEALKETKSIVNNELKLLPDYENRLLVLQELGFVDESQNVELKGRVACEISVGFELVITEILFDNFMSDLNPEEIVALLSCFIFNGSDRVTDDHPLLTNNMITGKTKIEDTYETFLALSSKYKIPLLIEESEFLMRNRFQLANVVYQWASGISFAEIMKISPQSEGTIVRVINRLNELCKQLKNASIIVGNSELHAKFSSAQDLINRDIVFAASLYL